MAKSLILLLSCFFMAMASATTFSPISIKNQIRQSDGVLQGEVITVMSEETPKGIVSKVTVLANKWIGIEPEDNFVDVYYPGGNVGDKIVKVHGSPQFEIGEKIILFTKIQDKKHWVNNLGLGKFSMKVMGERMVMINQIFPGHPQVGQMNVEKFYTLSEWVKKNKFKERYKDKYELNIEKEAQARISNHKKGRSIASIQEQQKSHNRLPTFWLVVLFGALGIVFGVFKNKSS